MGTHPILKGINGATAPTTSLNKSGPESIFDFQAAYPIIHPQNSVLYQVDPPPNQKPSWGSSFDWLLEAIDGSYCDDKSKSDCGIYEPTNVISISYGGPEVYIPLRMARRQCAEYMKLGLRGVSVVAASGNVGVVSSKNRGCLGEDADIFDPDFIATCPYITAVGATQLPRGGDPFNPAEQAVFMEYPPPSYNLTSGGGFSNIFKRPEYQASSVETYFARAQLDLPYYETVNNESFGADGGVYNRIGRAYPDVSCVGGNILSWLRGEVGVGGGTSIATPIFAAMLTRINEERLAAGMSSVGFVNPVLYAHPEAFRDVTEGYNEGCWNGLGGFEAIEGWDPVTGLGTPVFPKLLKVFMGEDQEPDQVACSF